MKALKMSLGRIIAAIVLTCLMAFPGGVMASPQLSLQTKSDWKTALDEGRITPVTSYYDALGAHYGTLGVDFIQVTPGLYALDDAESGGLGDGLLMTWGNGASNLPQVASWQYNYPDDPNLAGTKLNFTIMPPPGILSVSLTINDAAGGWISWDWNVTPRGGQGPLFIGVKTAITIDPNIFGPQGASSFAVWGFNPAIATTIQADELAVGANQWNVFPAVPVIGGAQPWNYWSQVSVVPIPPSILLLGAGLLGLAGLRRKLKN